MNSKASAKIRLLTTEELIQEIDPVKEKNFLSVVKEIDLSGEYLECLDNESIRAFFPTAASRMEYFNFIKRINKTFEIAGSDAREDIDSIASTSNCQENNECSSKVLEVPLPSYSAPTILTSSTPSNHKSISSVKKEWPFRYIYPKERLSVALQEKLSDPDKQLCFSEHNELVKVAFESILSYKM